MRLRFPWLIWTGSIAALLAACDSEKVVERSVYRERPTPVESPLQCDDMPDSLKDFELRFDVSIAGKAFAREGINQTRFRFTWFSDLENTPFCLYRFTGGSAEKLIGIKSDRLHEVYLDADRETILVMPVGRTTNGSYWGGRFSPVTRPPDFGLKANEIRTADEYVEPRIFLPPGSELRGKEGPLMVVETNFLSSDDGAIKSPYHLGLERNPVQMIVVKANRGQGSLEVKAFAYDPLPAGELPDAAPAVYVSIEEISPIRIRVGQWPLDGKAHRPICVKNGERIILGCGTDWQNFREKTKDQLDWKKIDAKVRLEASKFDLASP